MATERIEVDVAVVGGGACGQMTALRAAQNPDLVVGVFEKSTQQGCNAAISSGSLAAGGTRFQREAGIEDSPERFAEEILAQSKDERSRPVVEALTAVAPTYVEWIADELGYPIEIGVDMPRAGMSVPRLHTDVGRQGGGRLIRCMREAIDRHDNIAFVDESPAVGLLVEDGAVVGVRVVQNGAEVEVRASTVVLATDGFAASPELMKEYCSALGDPFYGGVSTSTGDAIPWLRDLGAGLRNMGACLRSGLVTVGHGTRVSPALQFNAAVLLDSEGRRFVDEESKGYSSLAGILQTLPGQKAAMIFDAAAMEVVRETEMMRECLAAGAISDATDLDALASGLGFSWEVVEAGIQPMPGRRSLAAPYHFAWVTHGVLTTQGGAVVDVLGRVLREDGSVISGVRAGGGTAVGLAGEHSDGYMSGNGLLSALGMGWIIGNDLATR